MRILAEEPRTIILYESPHRIVKTVAQLKEHLGPMRKACICREMTKIYEEVIRGTLGDLVSYCEKKKLKGELVIVIEGTT